MAQLSDTVSKVSKANASHVPSFMCILPSKTLLRADVLTKEEPLRRSKMADISGLSQGQLGELERMATSK